MYLSISYVIQLNILNYIFTVGANKVGSGPKNIKKLCSFFKFATIISKFRGKNKCLKRAKKTMRKKKRRNAKTYYKTPIIKASWGIYKA